MKLRRIIVHASLLALAVVLNAQTAYADTKLGKIAIATDYTYDDGEFEVDVTAEEEDFYIDGWESAEKDGKLLVDIQMYADSEFYFGSSSAGGFSITGGKFVSAARTDGNTALTLKVSITIPDEAYGEPSEPANLTWTAGTASWSSVLGASKYQVTLYRDDEEVTTKKVSATSQDFSSQLAKAEGTYYFTVQALTKAGETSGDAISREKVMLKGEWQQDSTGWWYEYSDDTYPESEWAEINNIWYYFDASGYMATGWRYLDNQWYYLEASGAMAAGWRLIDNHWYYLRNSGEMVIGWQQLNNTWYYLTQSGSMATGWIFDGSNWYYLSGSGAMLANTTTPDGYKVDKTGAWIE